MDVGSSHSGNEDDHIEWTPGAGNFGYFSRIEMNPMSQLPITTVTFDPFEELLWCGNINGRVGSFFGGSGFEKYTSFVATVGDVRAIEVTENAIISLSATQLKANTRQGLPVFMQSSASMMNMCCMFRLPGTSTLLLGGEQKQMIQYDFEKRKELRVAEIYENDATMIRSHGNYVFTADSDGNISMRSMSTLETIKVIAKAHGGPITDFDIAGNRLITCGCSFRLNALHGDPYVKIYDTRNFQALKPLALSFAPIFTRFLPTFYDSRVVLVSQMGQAQLTDLNDGGAGTSMLVESEGYALTAFNISGTKQLLAFGDEIGNIHVYADRPTPLINDSSFDTEFADPPLGPPQSFTIDDSHTALSSVPLPFSTDDTYLSDWPEDLCQPVFRKQKQCGPYPSIKNIQFVGYAPNPKANTPFGYFNTVPYYMDYETPQDDELEDDSAIAIPQFYRKHVMKQTRGQPDNSSILKYNKSTLVPLEGTLACLFVNPITQVIYQVTSLRSLLLCHLCEDEHCIACQLGFLFRMLSDKVPTDSAVSTNLIRSMTVSNSPSLQGDPLPTTQSLFNYIIDGIDKSLMSAEGKALTDLMEIELSVNSRCIRCGDITLGEEKKLSLTLQYPPAAEHLTICSLIEKALHARGQREGECSACSAKTRMEETRRVKRLPPVIMVDTNPTSAKFIDYWSGQLKYSERRPRYKKPENECSLTGIGKGDRACRYGMDCRNRPFCKYSHGNGDWEGECATWLSDTGGEWRHFILPRFTARVSNGIAILSEQSADSEVDTYELVAMVAGIGSEEAPGQWSHTVALIKEDEDKRSSWCVMNEALVTRVHAEEATHIDVRWKLPLVLVYVNKKAPSMQAPERRKSVLSSVFHTDCNLTGNEEVARERRGCDIPSAGEVVGIDAEFINITKDHYKKSVGRVSCVDNTGTKILIDDYVVTCDGDVVDDYLTQYSGIMEDDLDPVKSTKHLTTLKRVYLKILHLVERGVVFVGHGLSNDFSVLNIYVPPAQVFDTVHLFHLPQQRMISLQFLAWHLLGEKIQEGVHDSVEDARVALKLFYKWKELKENGTLDSQVQQLYEIGKQCNWRTGNSPSKSVSPSSE